MTRWFAWLLFAISTCAHAGDGRFGQHGMVLFGDRDGLYASHLPMFHTPHDVQVVIRLHLADARADAAMRARLAAHPGLWTLDPAPFDLDRLDPRATSPLRAFTADVVEGHFERGGSVRRRAAAVRVDRVVLYRRLSGDAAVRPVATYVPVGRFLVKLVDARPDFDHIVRLRRPAPGVIRVARTGLTANDAALSRQAAVAGTVYLDSADLQ